MRFSLFFKNAGHRAWHMIDGNIICAYRHAVGVRGGQQTQGLGRSWGGFFSKIYAKVDAFGGFVLTAGHVSDIIQAEALIGEESCLYLLADKGYDSNDFRAFLAEEKWIPRFPGEAIVWILCLMIAMFIRNAMLWSVFSEAWTSIDASPLALIKPPSCSKRDSSLPPFLYCLNFKNRIYHAHRHPKTTRDRA